MPEIKAVVETKIRPDWDPEQMLGLVEEASDNPNLILYLIEKYFKVEIRNLEIY